MIAKTLTSSQFAPIHELFRRGKARQAIKVCKRLGLPVQLTSALIHEGLESMLSRNQVASVLTCLHEFPELEETSPRGVEELLTDLLHLGDRSGFLKQVFRFKREKEHPEAIQMAIAELYSAGQADAAQGYERRLAGQTSLERMSHEKSSDRARELCDHTLKRLRKLQTKVTRVKERNHCQFYISNRHSADVYHQRDAVRLYVRAPQERLDQLLDLAEYDQLRFVKRSDQTKARNAARPLVAKSDNESDIDLIVPLIAYSHDLTADIENADESPISQPANPLTASSSTTHLEGRKIERKIILRERSVKARAACIARHGHTCFVCGFNFERVYGPIGRGFIEVHHLLQLSANERGVVDPEVDLAPVCANCHAMAHRRSPPYSLSELKKLMMIVAHADGTLIDSR